MRHTIKIIAAITLVGGLLVLAPGQARADGPFFPLPVPIPVPIPIFSNPGPDRVIVDHRCYDRRHHDIYWDYYRYDCDRYDRRPPRHRRPQIRVRSWDNRPHPGPYRRPHRGPDRGPYGRGPHGRGGTQSQGGYK